MHAYGLVVDVNPGENPYVGCGQSRDPALRRYRNRSRHLKGMVTPRAVAAFRAAGWGWAVPGPGTPRTTCTSPPPATSRRAAMDAPLRSCGFAVRPRFSAASAASPDQAPGEVVPVIDRCAHRLHSRDDGRDGQSEPFDPADQVAPQPLRALLGKRRDDDLVEVPSWTARSTASNGSGPPARPCTLPRAARSSSGIAASSVQSAALRLGASGTSRANEHGPALARRSTSSSSRGVATVRFRHHKDPREV
jgi:hypothetical protein